MSSCDDVVKSPLSERRCGILLHPTSLPGPQATGDLGPEAYRFIDWLVAAGQRVWQLLPMGPTHGDRSPYQSLSVHAGNPELISAHLLREWGLLHEEYEEVSAAILAAAKQFFQQRPHELWQEYERFCDENRFWLSDYARFVVIKQQEQGKAWFQWPTSLRDRNEKALTRFADKHADAIDTVSFEQFIFYRQWRHLRSYANERGVSIFGDMPIFVAHDSADVWADRQEFLLDENGMPTVIAGVPPDYFSETGQRWGNPHYDWSAMQTNGFQWWLQRFESQLKLFDLIRVDHFRGFQAYWEVPAHEETAMNGHWVEAPGDALFTALHERFNPLPVVAEDLGTITEEVLKLRDDYALPGMKILQFAFGGGSDNPYLPHNHEENSVVYTGTHDNDTTMGWFVEQPEHVRAHLMEYLSLPSEAMPWPLIRSCYSSVSRLAIVPMQDVLGLDSQHRMNTPGTTGGDNWLWRFDWSMVPENLAERLARMGQLYRR